MRLCGCGQDCGSLHQTESLIALDAIHRAWRSRKKADKQHGMFSRIVNWARANMPTREQLLSELGASMQAPLGQFVGALNGLLNTFVGALEALKQQKEAA